MFEWDSGKETINIQKHGISFELAAQVFTDPNRIEMFDSKHSTMEEERYITIGMLMEELIVLTVVYTERKERIRIISARRATKEERMVYGYGNDSIYIGP